MICWDFDFAYEANAGLAICVAWSALREHTSILALGLSCIRYWH